MRKLYIENNVHVAVNPQEAEGRGTADTTFASGIRSRCHLISGRGS